MIHTCGVGGFGPRRTYLMYDSGPRGALGDCNDGVRLGWWKGKRAAELIQTELRRCTASEDEFVGGWFELLLRLRRFTLWEWMVPVRGSCRGGEKGFGEERHVVECVSGKQGISEVDGRSRDDTQAHDAATLKYNCVEIDSEI
jgi:hypothetical protein